MKQVEVKVCPICSGEEFSANRVVCDFMVSKEDFSLVECNRCGFIATSPRPANENLGRYYQSEDYLSHNNNQKGWFASVYKLVRNYAVGSKFRLVAKHTAKGSLLDLGCGTGAFLANAQSKGWSVTGVEPSETARSFVADSLHGRVYDDKSALVEGDRFDVITMWHVLEHVPDLNEHWAFFKERLNDKGALVIAVPNHESWDAKHYGSFWAAWDTPIHLWHFSKRTMQLLAKQNGFVIVDIVNMPFDSFYVSMLSEKFKTGKMNVISSFCSGLWSNLVGWRKKNASSLIYIMKKPK